jgi:hypothetical protein
VDLLVNLMPVVKLTALGRWAALAERVSFNGYGVLHQVGFDAGAGLSSCGNALLKATRFLLKISSVPTRPRRS